MADLVKLTSLHTELNADAVEWCPIPGLENLLACATYELVENEEHRTASESAETQHRRGYLYLYQLQLGFALKEVCKIETPGILDCKWSPVKVQGNVCLAAVDAEGMLKLFKLGENDLILLEVSSLDLSLNGKALMLSLDWSNVLNQSNCAIVVSDSGGYVHVVSVDEHQFCLNSSRKAHEFEAWIAAFNYHDTNLFLSGGDDCKLRLYDLRTDPENAIKTLREHGAGVTSIQCNQLRENSVVTGSYDEKLLFWDIRAMKRPISEVQAPGGVWRIKHDPFEANLIACPCMYGGSAVINGSTAAPSVVATYSFHGSINYGIDWCRKKYEVGGSEDVAVLAVCSFYDKLLSLTYVPLETGT